MGIKKKIGASEWRVVLGVVSIFFWRIHMDEQENLPENVFVPRSPIVAPNRTPLATLDVNRLQR